MAKRAALRLIDREVEHTRLHQRAPPYLRRRCASARSGAQLNSRKPH
jgi:hypothetical protein